MSEGRGQDMLGLSSDIGKFGNKGKSRGFPVGGKGRRKAEPKTKSAKEIGSSVTKQDFNSLMGSRERTHHKS